MTRRRRGQSGFTLIELLAAMVVNTLILVPLLGWMVLGWGQQTALTHRAQDDTATDFLGIYLPRDVVNATDASLGGTDCAGSGPAPTTTTSSPTPTTTLMLPASTSSSAPDGAPPPVVLLVLRRGVDLGSPRVVYSIAPQLDGTGELWRRACTSLGVMTAELRIASELVAPPGGWEATASCGVRFSGDADTCSKISLTIRGPSGGLATVSASLRSGSFR
jgi:prepilin-type N-terminal cleavage/methylation domain-containing protein